RSRRTTTPRPGATSSRPGPCSSSRARGSSDERSATMIGSAVGDYRIVKQLGEGGMGMVYLGEHLKLGQKVAVKALHPTLFNNDNARDRFVREAEVLARLNHANIIRLLNFYNLPQGY